MPPIPNPHEDKDECPFLCEYCNDGMETNEYDLCDYCKQEFCETCKYEDWAHAQEKDVWYQVCTDCVNVLVAEAMKRPMEQRTILHVRPKLWDDDQP